MNVAVLYLAIGNYTDFWEGFYSSCEKNFLPGHEKQYFVFTDRPSEIKGSNVCVSNVDDLGWPLNTMFRFRYFLRFRDKLRSHDAIFFFNANAFICKPVSMEEMLPSGYTLTGVVHPGYQSYRKIFLPYERKFRASTAFVGRFEGDCYFQGCLNGGLSGEYMDLVEACNNNINSDLRGNIIARAHDESHLNRYFIGKKVNRLPPSYSLPEGWAGDAIISMRDKSKYSWYLSVKNSTNGSGRVLGMIKSFIKNIIVKYK